MKLTPDTVRAIAPVSPKTEIIVFDDDLPGFGVRACVSLGDVDELEVDEARQKAREILTSVRMGSRSCRGCIDLSRAITVCQVCVL